MNDDYLWDRSGEPDPEIQQLEEILGTLRYQPKPLQLAPLKLVPRRNYLALLAIAATVLISLVAGGLWLLLQPRDTSIPPVAFVTPVTPIPNPDLSVAPNAPKKHRPVLVKQDRRDRQEAIAAKQQLMIALRLASEKLNSAYRRTQTPSQIKNQHRAG
jgi:negative regulator of sigma E activity